MYCLARIPLLLTFLFFTLSAEAQWNSFIINFKKDVFGRGGQTWNIKACDDNHIFYANKNGLLQYNGDNWQLYPFNNGSHVRSVYISEKQKRIYAGGESEFGYFEPDHTGRLTYTILSDTFNEKYGLYGGYWGVYELDNMLYYVSDKHVIKLINDVTVVIESDFKIDCSAVIDGILFVGTVNGMWMLVGNTWMPVQGNGIQNKRIRAIVPYKDGFLAATAFDGLFYGDANSVKPFFTGEEEFMHRNEIFSLAATDHQIAVGTIHKGLLLIDTKTGKRNYYNDQNGLQNNTVLSIGFDKTGGLWLGLDNGIDYISLNTSLTSLYTNPYSKGAGYAALIHNNLLYLGTNRGLFYTPTPVEMGENTVNPQLIPELSGQVWGLEKVGEEIFCLHDKGLYLIKGTTVEVVPGFRGALICSPFESDPNLCWIGCYDGLSLIRKNNGKWNIIEHITGITNWMKNAMFETPYVIWVRNTNIGMTRIELDPITLQRKDTKTFNTTNGFESIQELYMHKVFGEMRFSTLSGIYLYDSSSNRMVKDEQLNAFFLPGQYYSKLTGIDNTLYALSPEMVQVLRYSDGKPIKSMYFPFDISQIDFNKAYETLIAVNDSMAIIPNEYGFALLNTELTANTKKEELFIRNVYTTYPKDSLLYTDNIIGLVHTPKISYKCNSLRFEYAIRSFGQSTTVEYRYRLLPDDLWSEPTTATVKEYSNLREGDYTFEVEVLLPDGPSDIERYDFTILPPWYRSIYAWIVYFCMILGLLYFIYVLEERRIARKRLAALEQKEYEMALKEKEYARERLRSEQEIIELKNEKLEQELTFKSQEMANLMIHFSRKNEILISIKEELSKITGEMKGEGSVKTKRMLFALNNSIDTNMESDDALKRFEEQFNLVHNNFMKKVREKHTDLTTGEIKMCAYVKMGLSSKEMAPLMNISVRGVETLRYRLRKKMGLEREDSLTEYLNTRFL